MANAINSINFGDNTYTFTLPYGTCSTAAATAAKTVDVDNFSLETGARVAVKFTYTNTASSPTLNVESTGAKSIYYNGAAITATYLIAGKVYEFIYNGTQWDVVGEVGSIPLAGTSSYDITGSLLFADSGTTSGTFRGVQGKCGSNDYWRVGGSQTGSNAGYMEIATADDASEPIYVRQYTGTYTTLSRTATLLDGSGNTSFPNTLTAGAVTSSGDLTVGGSATVSGATTIAGTLTLSKTQDLSGTANNSPALIIGGAATSAHIEIDPNEIQAKSDGTTPTTLNLNHDGGGVIVGSGGLTVTGTATMNAGVTHNGTTTLNNTVNLKADMNWTPTKNIKCTPTANSQEWSFDVGSTSYTGAMWHVYSSRNDKTMLACYADDNHVTVPNGNFAVAGTVKVGNAVTMAYDSTNECLNFTFA